MDWRHSSVFPIFPFQCDECLEPDESSLGASDNYMLDVQEEKLGSLCQHGQGTSQQHWEWILCLYTQIFTTRPACPSPVSAHLFCPHALRSDSCPFGWLLPPHI